MKDIVKEVGKFKCGVRGPVVKPQICIVNHTNSVHHLFLNLLQIVILLTIVYEYSQQARCLGTGINKKYVLGAKLRDLNDKNSIRLL